MIDDATMHLLVRQVTVGFELAGVAAIVAGALLSVVLAGLAIRRGGSVEEIYRELRSNLGRSILLGLELLVAADIINTVAIGSTLQSVAVLAAVVAIRTFLSMALQLEIDGRWPWQRPR